MFGIHKSKDEFISKSFKTWQHELLENRTQSLIIRKVGLAWIFVFASNTFHVSSVFHCY